MSVLTAEDRARLFHLADKARSLHERLAGSSERVDDEAREILERWQTEVAGEDSARFRRHLAWHGHTDREALLRALSAPFDATTTPWLATLEAIVLAAREGDAHPLRAGAPKPFEDLFFPALAVARRSLVAKVADVDRSLSSEAVDGALSALLSKLTYAFAPAVHVLFDASRPCGLGFLAELLDAPPSGAREHYEAFVASAHADGLLGLFERYPVMAKLIAESIDDWSDAIAELVLRLRDDEDEIDARFGGRGRIVGIDASVSDLHHHGRSVALLRFEDGPTVVYKPRSLGLEAAFSDLLAWCNERGCSFAVPSVLDRGTHGWMELVAQRPCASAEEAALFYSRSGMLLALVHALRGTDFHLQNIVACGPHPIPIDLETVMTHASLEEAPAGAIGTFVESVLRTGLLPCWEVEGDNAYDVSALGSIMATSEVVERPIWSAVNTDEMTFATRTVSRPLEKNAPMLGGAVVPPDVDAIVSGFSSMTAFLVEHRAELPLDAFVGQPARYIHRPTRAYVRVREASLDPALLRRGVDRSSMLEGLFAPLLGSTKCPPAWTLVREEIAAIERLDIPHFAARTDDDRLTLGVEANVAVLRGNAIDDVRASLMRLGPTDLARQIGIIRGSFFAKLAPLASNEPLEADAAPLSNDALLDEAVRIGEEVLASAIAGEHGALGWIGLTSAAGSDRLGLAPLDLGLYKGTTGVGLFFAALAWITGRDDFQMAARGAFRALFELSDDDATDLVKHMGIGGATGVGSIVYGLTLAHRFDSNARYLERATELAALVDSNAIASDRRLDVTSGAAGALLSFLALYEATRDVAWIAKARACADHLLRHRRGTPGAWRTVGEAPIAGFSHGAAGIAHALFRLHAIAPDSALRDAALDAVAYERTLYSRERKNWRAASDTFRVQWCHGAPGIALGRLDALEELDDASRAEVAHALVTTRDHGVASIDHLCCGNSGRIDVLATAGRRLDRDDLVSAARAQASAVIRRARAAGGYRLFADVRASSFGVSFFQGTSGIGYGLLRLCDATLPNVLAVAS